MGNATATDLLSCRSATWCKSSSWTKKRKWHTANNAFSWLTNQGNDLSGPCNWKVDDVSTEDFLDNLEGAPTQNMEVFNITDTTLVHGHLPEVCLEDGYFDFVPWTSPYTYSCEEAFWDHSSMYSWQKDVRGIDVGDHHQFPTKDDFYAC